MMHGTVLCSSIRILPVTSDRYVRGSAQRSIIKGAHSSLKRESMPRVQIACGEPIKLIELA